LTPLIFLPKPKNASFFLTKCSLISEKCFLQRALILKSYILIPGVADKGNGGQPASPGKWKRCKEKKMNSKF
jgi:hypothetical protein